MLLPDWRQSILVDYGIVLTPQSYRDLDEVFAMVLRLSADKDTAYNYVDAIKTSIKNQKHFPIEAQLGQQESIKAIDRFSLKNTPLFIEWMI